MLELRQRTGAIGVALRGARKLSGRVTFAGWCIIPGGGLMPGSAFGYGNEGRS